MKNLFILVAAVAIFTSCRTVKKVTDTRKETVEEITQSREDSTGVKTSVTTTVTTGNEEDSTTIEVVFDTEDNDNPIKPEDYVSVDSSGNIVIKGRIKTVKGKTTSKKSFQDSTTTQTKDTASISKQKTVEKKQVVEEKHSTTDRKGIVSVLAWPVFIAALIVFIFFMWKREREKKKANNS